QLSYEAKLSDFIVSHQVEELRTFEIDDRFMEARIQHFCKIHALRFTQLRSPKFLTSRSEFGDYLAAVEKPFMKTFYEQRRRSMNLLMHGDRPEGGRFSFDAENRRRLPKTVEPPELPTAIHSEHTRDVLALVERQFPDHPGRTTDFWLPTTRPEARRWADRFFTERLPWFGDFQDALTHRSNFVFHSVLTPWLNMGLLTPEELVRDALDAYATGGVSLNSVEGFIRQVVGWREFVNGIYRHFDDQQSSTNFFGHRRQLSRVWYGGTSGVPPLDDALKKVERYGYAHHIERLMLFANIMLLCRVAPLTGHRWFMEQFVDSADWVMGPNVYGMGLFSDGGLFATKPYICGSNYWLKMSDYKRGEWCDAIDGLYWDFIADNRAFFAGNHRMKMMTTALDKMTAEKRARLSAAAQELTAALTTD
ncbi:MAG: cryptochrome/photolyase family protein, partial [Bdellovibrionales bacterium]|nr:cryptochrome/photolyase family protein [Bdellovibrionales bacterium]